MGICFCINSSTSHHSTLIEWRSRHWLDYWKSFIIFDLLLLVLQMSQAGATIQLSDGCPQIWLKDTLVWSQSPVGFYDLSFQNKSRSSPFHHKASQLVWGVWMRTNMLCLVLLICCWWATFFWWSVNQVILNNSIWLLMSLLWRDVVLFFLYISD